MQFITSNVAKKMFWGFVCLELGGQHMHSSCPKDLLASMCGLQTKNIPTTRTLSF